MRKIPQGYSLRNNVTSEIRPDDLLWDTETKSWESPLAGEIGCPVGSFIAVISKR